MDGSNCTIYLLRDMMAIQVLRIKDLKAALIPATAAIKSSLDYKIAFREATKAESNYRHDKDL